MIVCPSIQDPFALNCSTFSGCWWRRQHLDKCGGYFMMLWILVLIVLNDRMMNDELERVWNEVVMA
jgi:hypothetical protein